MVMVKCLTSIVEFSFEKREIFTRELATNRHCLSAGLGPHIFHFAQVLCLIVAPYN